MSVRLSEAPSCEGPLGAYDFGDSAGSELPRFASIKDAGLDEGLQQPKPFCMRCFRAPEEIRVHLGRLPCLSGPMFERVHGVPSEGHLLT